MKNKLFIYLIVISIFVFSIGTYLYLNNFIFSNKEIAEETVLEIDLDKKYEIKVLRPNGNEKINYGEIYMAGDLMFEWTSSYGKNDILGKTEVSLVNEFGEIVRREKINHLSYSDDGNFISSLIGEVGIKPDSRYKIIICDNIEETKVCDTSDDYFYIVSNNESKKIQNNYL
ncbi:MAG TPA: hypothetical protein PJ997_02745 [Candidatus Paceibacterota bacterium]|nr:hypothetical protein [Candidatus Paceibacterota bacterium]HMP19230.1 hypothetical protein [Candidatus Paceibacterota bacterium]HMP85510.1 hypothetical protein [Candidatus Paceibacterota bacterium]